MSVPLILTILAGAATFIGAFLGVLGQKPSNRLLAFSLLARFSAFSGKNPRTAYWRFR